MTENFIKHLAEDRAEKIFTSEFFLHVTDAWYMDEKFRFEGLKVGTEERKPTGGEADIYMKYLSDLFKEYEDKFYPDVLAQSQYGKCIDCFDKIFKFIKYGNETYSRFNIDEDIIYKLKDIANIFVNKHNEFCKYEK